VVQGRLADNTLTLDMSSSNRQGLKASADLTLPTEASATPFRIAIARKQPMRGRFSAQGEIRRSGTDHRRRAQPLGMVQTEGTLGGTLADPTASGQIAVSTGRFDDGATGLSLRDVALKANFTNGGVDVTEARGVDGHGGSVSGQGRMSLMREGVSSFKLDLKDFG
jgi:translocation and assembly module TamB